MNKINIMKVETRKTARVSARAAPATRREAGAERAARQRATADTHTTQRTHTHISHTSILSTSTHTHFFACVYVGLRNVGLYALVRAIGHAHTTFYTNCRSPLHVHAVFSVPPQTFRLLGKDVWCRRLNCEKTRPLALAPAAPFVEDNAVPEEELKPPARQTTSGWVLLPAA